MYYFIFKLKGKWAVHSSSNDIDRLKDTKVRFDISTEKTSSIVETMIVSENYIENYGEHGWEDDVVLNKTKKGLSDVCI